MTDAADELQENKDEQGISGKWFDYRAMTKTRKACESWESRKGTEEYELS